MTIIEAAFLVFASGSSFWSANAGMVRVLKTPESTGKWGGSGRVHIFQSSFGALRHA